MFIYVIDSMSNKEAFSWLSQKQYKQLRKKTNILPEIICNSPKSTRKKILCSEIEMLRKHVEVLQKK